MVGSPRKLKKHKSKTGQEEQKKDKGKSRAADGEFTNVNSTLVVSIAPVFANDPRVGVEEMLDSMVMRCVDTINTSHSEIQDHSLYRYIPAFRGVVLAYSNMFFLDNNGLVKGDCPYINCSVGFDATVWSPQVGMKLGKSYASS
jgi:DNA-directed RNA polymerase I subunit RPA43